MNDVFAGANYVWYILGNAIGMSRVIVQNDPGRCHHSTPRFTERVWRSRADPSTKRP